MALFKAMPFLFHVGSKERKRKESKTVVIISASWVIVIIN